jgi:hypothetical protein
LHAYRDPLSRRVTLSHSASSLKQTLSDVIRAICSAFDDIYQLGFNGPIGVWLYVLLCTLWWIVVRMADAPSCPGTPFSSLVHEGEAAVVQALASATKTVDCGLVRIEREFALAFDATVGEMLVERWALEGQVEASVAMSHRHRGICSAAKGLDDMKSTGTSSDRGKAAHR